MAVIRPPEKLFRSLLQKGKSTERLNCRFDFHPLAQRNAFRRSDVHQQSSLFAPRNQRLKHNPAGWEGWVRPLAAMPRIALARADFLSILALYSGCFVVWIQSVTSFVNSSVVMPAWTKNSTAVVSRSALAGHRCVNRCVESAPRQRRRHPRKSRFGNTCGYRPAPGRRIPSAPRQRDDWQ